MVKRQLQQDLKKAVEDLGFETTDIVCDISQNPAFGDYTSNIALQLAKQNLENGKQSPLDIANKILSHLGDLSNLGYLEKVEIADPGFLNFFIKPEFLAKEVAEILKLGPEFAKNNFGKGEKVQVEFISANPTGPLTLGNGRGGSIGSTLANVLKISGYQVETEFYVNDTGNQVRRLGESILAALGKVEPQEEHYQGEYVKDLAKVFADKTDLEAQELGHLAADYLLEQEIKPAIKRLGIEFDEYYSERSLYQKDLVDKTVKLLEEKGVAYQKDGAVWFKATEFGDEKDRVLLTSEEGRGRKEPTYFLADIAHHIDVLERGYQKRINVLGADHHGYALRIKGAVEAAGFKDKVDLIFMQLVKLFKEGKEVRMSKRAGNFVTLDELLDLVGKDVARFFFLMYMPDSHIDFNLDLAQERSNKNPVFYVQYAHARMANILSKMDRQQVTGNSTFNALKHQSELDLIKHLLALPDLVEEIAVTYQVHKLTAYSMKLADLFHKFYESCRVLNAESEELREARLGLVEAAKITLGKTLNLMGIEAPERM